MTATLAKPMAIYQSPRDPNRHIYYRLGILGGSFTSSMLRVLVQFRNRRFGGSRGYWVSAYAVSGPSEGETIIWP